LRQLSLAIVGSQFPNKRGPDRRFEIAVCAPGDEVALVHEPKNRADQNAIMVLSERGVQMGYISADRTSLIHRVWREKRSIRAVFQEKTDWGAWVRVSLDGSEPALPSPIDIAERDESAADPDAGFWPDFIPPDE